MFHLTAVLRDRSNTVKRSLEDGCLAETYPIVSKRLTKIVPYWFYSLIPADVSTKVIAVMSICIDTVKCCAYHLTNVTSLSPVLPSSYLGFVYENIHVYNRSNSTKSPAQAPVTLASLG